MSDSRRDTSPKFVYSHETSGTRMRIGDIAFRAIGAADAALIEDCARASNAWVVKADQVAAEIAPLVEHNEVDLLVVTDPTDADRVEGILSPRHVREEVGRRFGGDANQSFTRAVELLETNPKPGGIFGHEYLNTLRPQFYICKKGGHILTDKPPCPKHG